MSGFKDRGRIAIWSAISLIAILSLYELFRLRDVGANHPAREESAFTRVNQSGELRVGYLIEPPYLSKETSTGRLTGIFYDITEELGKRLGLRVSWVEETGLSTLSVGLDAGRYDMIAFPLWRSAARAKVVAFSTPLFYTTVGVYVREGDHRFDSDLSKINDSLIKVAGIDGELAASIAESDFPKAKVMSLPNLTDYSQMLLEVATGKADVTFFSRVQAKRFMRQNPGKIREVPQAQPIRVFAECFILPISDGRLQEMINASLLEMIDNGVIEKIFLAHGETVGDYTFPITPYRESRAKIKNQ